MGPANGFRPGALALRTRDSGSAAHISFRTKSFKVILAKGTSVRAVASGFAGVGRNLARRLRHSSVVSVPSFHPLLPSVSLGVATNGSGPVCGVLRRCCVAFSGLGVRTGASPRGNFFLSTSLFGLVRSAAQVSAVYLVIQRSSLNLLCSAGIVGAGCEGRRPFATDLLKGLHGAFISTGLGCASNRNGANVQLKTHISGRGRKLHLRLFPRSPVLTFHAFGLGASGCVLCHGVGSVTTSIQLANRGGTSL